MVMSCVGLKFFYPLDKNCGYGEAVHYQLLIFMEDVLEILVGPYEIRRIIIDNFALGKDVTISVILDGNAFGLKTVVFKGVTSINCNPESYRVIKNGSISTLDISDKKWKGVNYRVDILEDAFSFYCTTIEVS